VFIDNTHSDTDGGAAQVIGEKAIPNNNQTVDFISTLLEVNAAF
jgi:hypothetical protein